MFTKSSFQPNVCNGSQNLMKKLCMLLKLQLFFAKRNFEIYWKGMNINQSLTLMKKADLNEKKVD